MIDVRLNESERRSWIYVISWTFVIFITIPLARKIQAFVSNNLGRDLFTYGVIAIIIVMLVFSMRRLKLKKQTAKVSSYVWLTGISFILISYSIYLGKKSPEEAVHFIQYGVLAILIFRALTHRITDQGIYIVAIMCTLAIGILDETIQWLTPGRYWGLRDIWLNSFAAVLVLLAIAKGLHPRLISGAPVRATVKILYRITLVIVILFGLSMLNTPPRIAWYVDKLPMLDFILSDSGIMVEYGYRYNDNEIGVFRSRLAPDKLKQSDQTRADTVAKILNLYSERSDYKEFLRLYTPFNDPFLHEARVHLHRRDTQLQDAQLFKDKDLDEYRRRISIAYYENMILEKYFTETLSKSALKLPVSTVNLLQGIAMQDVSYDSPVSGHLLTRISERQVLWVSLLLVLIILIIDRRLPSRPKP